MKINRTSITDFTSPKLSIGLGAYNNARFLRGSLDALLSQTFRDFELIISDNASTDETHEIIEEYAKKDTRIRVFRQSQNIGLVRNFNFLFKQARGEYFMWTACDDRVSPNFIETILLGMEKDQSILLGFTPYQYTDEKEKPFGQVQKFDLSGNNAGKRLLRFFYFNDDSPVYGIFRGDAIKDLEYPVWWGRNSDTPLDSGYPFLAYVLARGNFQLFGDRPLLSKCIKSEPHFQPFVSERKVIQYFLLFLLRKINVAWEQFWDIRQGSNSIILAILFIPILLLRMVLDTIILISNIIRKNLKKRIALSRQ